MENKDKVIKLIESVFDNEPIDIFVTTDNGIKVFDKFTRIDVAYSNTSKVSFGHDVYYISNINFNLDDARSVEVPKYETR